MTLLSPGFSRRGFLALAGAAAAFGVQRPAAAQPAMGARRVVGANIYELAASASTNTVYVAAPGAFRGNAGGGPGAQIVALDGETLEQRAAIALEAPGFGVGLNDRTQTLFVTNTTQGSIAIVDLRGGRLAATARAGEGNPHLRQVVVDEATNTAYATVFGARDNPSAIWVVDGNAGRVARVLTEGLAEGGITGLALDAPRRRLYATAMSSHEVVEVDIDAGKAVRRFAAGGEGSVNIALDLPGRRAFVTNQRSGDLAVLNLDSGAVIKVVKTGEGALGVTHDAARSRLYVANRRAGTVSVLDSRTLDVLAQLETGTHPNTVAVNARTGLAYASNKRRSGGRGQPPPEDPNGDTVTIIRP